jgi:hypothetical protein
LVGAGARDKGNGTAERGHLFLPQRDRNVVGEGSWSAPWLPSSPFTQASLDDGSPQGFGGRFRALPELGDLSQLLNGDLLSHGSS